MEWERVLFFAAQINSLGGIWKIVIRFMRQPQDLTQFYRQIRHNGPHIPSRKNIEAPADQWDNQVRIVFFQLDVGVAFS
ncbi:Uncharacterised protein [Chlamydia abortus]|nr:Uncharacterised protein [Chlamydia abortus]